MTNNTLQQRKKNIDVGKPVTFIAKCEHGNNFFSGYLSFLTILGLT